MKEIVLTKGKVALVDDADYDWLMQWKWCVSQHRDMLYAVRSRLRLINEKGPPMIRMHRQILGIVFLPSVVGDHINHDTLDNRRSNLRTATYSQSNTNKRRASTCSSQYRGVTFDKWSGKWKSQIAINGKLKNLGHFSTQEDAFRAYMEIAPAIKGDFLCLDSMPIREEGL